jgi:hypothetical protein
MTYDPLNSRQAIALGILYNTDPMLTAMRTAVRPDFDDLASDAHRLVRLLDDAEDEIRYTKARLIRETEKHQTTRKKLIQARKELSSLKRK